MIKKVISFFTALSLTLMLFTGIPIGVSAVDDIAINATNFPDEIFRNYIKENFDTDNSNSLSASEIANAKKIDVDKKNISDLTGIGYFTALTELIAKNNNLTSIDLSQNTELKTLNLYNNHLTSIDLSKNTKLNNINLLGNTYDVSSIVDSCIIEISSLSSILPTGFDLNNVSRWIEGKLIDNDTKILCLGDPPVVTYTYKSGIDYAQLTVSLELSGHSCTKTEAKDATCTEDGNKEYWTCSDCGYKLKKEKPEYTSDIFSSDADIVTKATGHSYSTTWTTGADQHWHACLNSGCTDKGDAANHTFVQKKDGTNHWQECSVCGYKNDETAHSWGNWTLTTEPTLNTTGTAERTCICGEKQTKADVPTLTDTTVWTKDGGQHVDPTEEDTGKDVYTSEYGEVEVVLPKKEHTHDWGNWSITSNPTLTTTGTAERACTKDGTHTETKELPVLTDTTVWTKDGSQHVDPTEEDTGKDVYTSEYGNVEVVLPKKEHTHVLVKTDAQAADCTTNGNEAYWTCSGCDKMFLDENGTREITAIPTIPATGHKFLTEWANNETYHWHAATCGHDVVSDKAVHSWDSGIVTTEPTEEAAGVKTFTCTVCSATRTESVSQIPHTHTYSTEWTSDSTSHWHAATCGHDVTSEAAAHTEDSGTVTIPPTTENDGVKTYACSVCGYVMRTATIPKLGEDHTHNFSPDWKHDSTSHWHECDCGEKNDIAPHVEDGGVVTTEPTETSTGIMTYSCETCGYVMRTDVIPALIPEHNHTFGTDWKYDSVSHWHECECGEKSDIANHISSDWIVVTPATTDLEGVQIRRCTVCGIELDRETIEKLPNISTGDVAEDVRDTAGTNAGLVQDNTLIENVLTTDDKTEVTEGHSFEIVLEVTDIRDSVPAADVTAASSSLKSDEKIGIYVDLSLFKIKDNSERTPIYNTSGRIGITLTIPESIYASDRTYSIIRVHDGIAENLGGTYDKASRELTFYTDKFSTYAIAYAASNGGTDRPSVPDTPTNPSVPTYPNTPVVPVTPTVTETTVKKEEEVISDEPYVEDVSSAAGIYESGETDNNIHYVMILIFAAAAGVAAIAAKKRFGKKNMK